jgi:hypothetical protein
MRRRRLFALLVFLFTLVVGATTARALPGVWRGRALDALLPGTSTKTVAHLDPRFRKKVDAVFGALRERGYEPRVRSAWRSPDRQDFIYDYGKLRQHWLGGGPSTQARGGRSCHNQVDGDGRPASRAIDVFARGVKTTKAKARFYKALGEEAKKRGLVWGGDYKKRNKVWKRHGLGWDPAHIQMPRCRPRSA